MKRMNNKGFSLVEVLAVIIILGVLITIMVPTVNSLIKKNKEDNMKQLQASIVSAAKLYISDNKYNIEFNGSCDDSSSELMIRKINDLELTESHLLLDTLVNEGYLKTNAGNIINPENDKNLDLNASYITIQYSCQTKIFDYDDEPNLIVQE